MTILKLFDYLAIAALAFMSYGILQQWHHIFKNRSARDIVAQEVLIRFAVTLVLLVKIFLVGDVYLIIGQLILMAAISIYTFTLLYIKLKIKQ